MDNLVYAEDQWSPLNLEGKKKYESDFLRKLQSVATASKLPENITLPKNIVKETNREFKPIGGGGFSYGKENNLMPSFVPSFSPKRDPRMRDGMPKIIKSISLSADVKLNESENAWKPNKRLELSEDDKSELDDLVKKVRSIVNKITPEKFDKLMGQVKEFKIDTQEKLEGVINLIFLKAIDEPSFSHVYAKMCYDLSTYVRLKTDVGGEGETVISFKRLLITRCQQEYERQNQDDFDAKREEELKKIEEAEGVDKKDLTLKLQEVDRKRRVR
jgi:translation initiation factor 4G